MAEVTRLGRITLLDLKAGVARLSRESILTNANHAALARLSRMTIWIAEPIQKDFQSEYLLNDWGQSFRFGYNLGALPILSHTSPHRYWRLRARTANGQPNVQLSEVYFLGEGDQDLFDTVGGIVIASSEVEGFEAVNAFDRDENSSWVAAGHAGQWIGVYFDAEVLPSKLKIVASHDEPSQNPVAMAVEFSDDGELWTPVMIWRDEDGAMSASEEREFDITLTDYITTGDNDPHTFWRARFFVTGADSERQQLAALDWVDDARYSFLKNTGAEFTSSVGADGGYPLENLYDFRPLTYWEQDTYYGYVHTVEFDTARAVKGLRARAGDTPSQAPQAVIVEYSDDGITWTLKHLEREISWTAAKENRYFMFMDAQSLVYRDFDFNYLIEGEEPGDDDVEIDLASDFKIRGMLGEYAFAYKIDWAGPSFTFGYKIAFNWKRDFDYAIKLWIDFDFDYKLEGITGQHFDFDYKIALNADFDFTYKVILRKSFTSMYKIEGPIARELSSSYKIALNKSITSRYRIALRKTLDFDYAVNAIWNARFNFAYVINGVWGRVFNSSYRIRLGNSYNFAYNVTGAPGQTVQPPSVIGFLPEIPVNEVWQYETRIVTSINNKEQRHSLRRYPQVNLAHEYIIDSYESYSVFRDMLLCQSPAGLYVPMHALAVFADERTSENDTTVYLNTDASDFRAGEKCAIVHVGTEQIISRTVAAVAADHIEIDEGFPFATGRGVAVMPARAMRITETSRLGVEAIAGRASIGYEDATAGRPIMRPGADPILTYLDGRPLLDMRPLANSAVDEGYLQGYLKTTLSRQLPASWLRRWPIPAGTRAHSWVIPRGAGLDLWRELAEYTRGSWKPFLLPTFRPDLRPRATVGAVLTVDGTRLQTVLAQREYEGLRLELTSGDVLNTKIVGASISGGQTEITLADEPTAPVAFASFINLVRIADDRISFAHHDQHSIVSLNLRIVTQ
jgi:hypothetical protein